MRPPGYREADDADTYVPPPPLSLEESLAEQNKRLRAGHRIGSLGTAVAVTADGSALPGRLPVPRCQPCGSPDTVLDTEIVHLDGQPPREIPIAVTCRACGEQTPPPAGV